jgi:hypothetical protein
MEDQKWRKLYIFADFNDAALHAILHNFKIITQSITQHSF